ncbi:putative reverse transcriptase domain-containing protein [Tanacetum coccineum]|uniref:Reverse transcriptase domain-containing protein n=1 Tax=Tanacetum coccineum TaxID=301880 RepID=A0ABQ5BVS8_9ASTR
MKRLELTQTILVDLDQQILEELLYQKMHGCSYKTFMNGKPHSFKGTEGVVGLKVVRKDGANPLGNVKAMMTTEYCPATKIQRMEQELWTLTLKGDDIEAYNNRFHELALMCHELVHTEKKKIERSISGFLKESKGNINSSKPATLHGGNLTWP